jgi:hypothetical protein
MNVEIGVEAALFPEKEYINGIAFAVYIVGRCDIDSFSLQMKLHGFNVNVQKNFIVYYQLL